jgi:methylated-DNA-protein-cysteine methyltransferase related protein
MMSHFTSSPQTIVFNARVWEIVRQVPPGHVTCYGQIAAMIPPPAGMDPKSYDAFAARWVGGAMATCPEDVPWQRVINSQGKLSLRAGAERQRELLEEEGIIFNEKGRVDLKKFGWQGPPVEWLRQRNLYSPPGFHS